MALRLDLHGRRFGRLVVIARAANTCRTRWMCRCDCGNETIVFSHSLTRGLTKSCGCLRNENTAQLAQKSLTTHGLAHSYEYRAWAAAKDRCFNKKNKDYPKYGGRGIGMHPLWVRDFSAFFAHIGPRPQGCLLDRRDNDGPYEPGNVRWVTPAVSTQNRRTAHGPHGKYISTAVAP